MRHKHNLFVIVLLLFSFIHSQSIQSKIDSLKTTIDSLENKSRDLEKNQSQIILKIDSLESELSLLINSSNYNKSFSVRISLPASLRSKPASGQNIIDNIPTKETITIFPDYYENYYKILYDQKLGYINKMYVTKIPLELTALLNENAKVKEKQSRLIREENKKLAAEKLKKLIEQRKLENDREEKQRKLYAERVRQQEEQRKSARKQEMEAKYSLPIATMILAEIIWIGMTDEMAIDSIGYPKQRNRTVTKYGVSEQWVYNSKYDYLYFEDGILTSWQD